MAASKPVWGIDLGQRALKAIRLRAGTDRVEVLDHVFIEHTRILSQPDADRPALIAETMGKFTEQHDLSKDLLVVAVPGQNTLARFTKLPPVDKKKIPEIVKYEAQQQIPFDMEEVIWDYQVFEDPEGMETEVGIFAMRRELLREHLHFLTQRNLEPAIVQSAPLALYNALKYDGLCGEEAITILDIGAQNTDLIVADGDSLWTRNIPIGGNNFTEALLKTFKLSFRKAERLKRDAQKHKYARQIFQAMRPVFADLVAEVQRSIGFFTSSRRGVKLSKVLAMGNAFRLPGMVKFMQQNLGMDVVRPTTFSKLSASEAPRAPELMDQMLSFGVAYGLALQGLGLAPITSNLIPVEIQKQVVWRKKTPWFYGAAACLLLSAGLVWARNFIDAGEVSAATGGEDARSPAVNSVDAAVKVVENGPPPGEPVKQQAETVIAAANALNRELADVRSSNDEVIRHVKEIVELQEGQLVWPVILDLIHQALPEPDETLIAAMKQGPEACRKLIEEQPEKYRRGERRQVYILEFEATYAADVMARYQDLRGQGLGSGSSATPGVGGRMGSSSAAPAGGARQPGFVIQMRVQTPNERGYAFVNETFLAKLRQATSDKVDVYFDQFYPMRSERLLAQAGRLGSTGRRSRSGYPGAFSMRRPAGAVGAIGATEDAIKTVEEKTRDPLTGESVENDWDLDLIFVAVLGKKPEAPAAAGAPVAGAPAAGPGGARPGASPSPFGPR